MERPEIDTKTHKCWGNYLLVAAIINCILVFFIPIPLAIVFGGILIILVGIDMYLDAARDEPI